MIQGHGQYELGNNVHNEVGMTLAQCLHVV